MTTTDSPSVLTLDALLAHWQGHRALTRRVIKAFPEDQLFSFTAAPPNVAEGVAATRIDDGARSP